MQIQVKTGGILYDHGGKLGSNYPDLEPGREFWNRVCAPGSDYKAVTTVIIKCQNRWAVAPGSHRYVR